MIDLSGLVPALLGIGFVAGFIVGLIVGVIW